MTSTAPSSRHCSKIPRPERSFRVRAVSESCAGAWPVRANEVGLRVIYFLRTRQGQIWMLTIYPKNVAENIPAHVLRQIREEIDG
jgi:hypothetical protein